MIKFVSNLRQDGGFLRVLRFPPTIKLTATLQLKYCWNGAKHHQHLTLRYGIVKKLLVCYQSTKTYKISNRFITYFGVTYLYKIYTLHETNQSFYKRYKLSGSIQSIYMVVTKTSYLPGVTSHSSQLRLIPYLHHTSSVLR